jgi:hypothetical protein
MKMFESSSKPAVRKKMDVISSPSVVAMRLVKKEARSPERPGEIQLPT